MEMMYRLIRTSLHASDEKSKNGGDRSHRLKVAVAVAIAVASEQATASLMKTDVRGQRYVHPAEICRMRQQSAALSHRNAKLRVDRWPQRFPAALQEPTPSLRKCPRSRSEEAHAVIHMYTKLLVVL
jgi:hypothetical protein